MRTTLFTILAFLLISNVNAGNTWQTATPLPQDASVAGIQSDDDWYVINISSNQSVKRLLIDLTFSHADGSIDMDVYGDDFVSYDPAESVPGLFRAISDSISDHEFIDHNVTVYSPETYYIRVSGEDLGNGYTLTWTELTGTDDGFEENDSSASVKAITEDVVIFGAQSDEDWYSIDVTLGNRRVFASLRFTKIDNLDMVLRDSDGNPLASSTSSVAGVNEIIDFEVFTAGVYHLQITGDSSGDGYALDWAGIGVNEAPQATANTVSTTENTPYNFVASDFTFSDNEGDSLVSATLDNLSLAGGTLTHSSGTPVSNADTLTAAQLDTLVYTPPADTTGSPLASFAFTVNDIDAGTVSALLDINVTAVTAVTTTTTDSTTDTAADTAATDTSSSSSALALSPAGLLVLLLTGLLRRKRC